MLRLGGHFSPGLSSTLRQEVPDSDAVTFPGNPAGLEGVPGTSGCPSTCVIALLGPPPISSVAGELRHPENGKSTQRLTKQRLRGPRLGGPKWTPDSVLSWEGVVTLEDASLLGVVFGLRVAPTELAISSQAS